MTWLQQFRSVPWREAGWFFLGTYLLGCVTTGYYLVRGRTGQDIRQVGSGSTGARNAGRVLGWSGFLLVVLGDFIKGATAVWAARQFTPDDRLAGVAMLGVIAGHIWPVQLGFRGGKGVATSLGALLVYDPHLAIAFALLFGAGLILTRRMVLAGLLAFGGVPFVSVWLGGTPMRVIALSGVAALVLVAHRRNVMDIFAPLAFRREMPSKHSARDL